jgi:4-amino-4-deoxy-L-arabinose transferase-like glycosyltransferase
MDAKTPTRILVLLAGLLLALGLSLRLFDLTDEPIDFHPTRQLRGAIIARGMYYEMQPNANPVTRDQAMSFWASTGQYEPSILERSVAISDLVLGKEIPWLARLYNSIFWVLGGAALWDLARRMAKYALREHSETTSDLIVYASALIALGYYLVLPFSVQASRAFQPDPGMTVWIILAAYAAYRWSDAASRMPDHGTWKWTLFSGVCSGMAVLTKAVAFYPIAGILILITIHTFRERYRATQKGFFFSLGRLMLSPQIWCMAILTLLPTGIYYLTRGGRVSEYFSSWTLALLHMLLEPLTYLRWANLVQELVNPFALVLALAGILLARGRNLALLAGMWLGYIAYGLFLPYQMTSHSYYHLQLIPFVALSLVPVAQTIIKWLVSGAHQRMKVWQALAAIIVSGLFLFSTWQALIPLYSQDYRNEPAYWEQIASYLPANGKILALTQDYGYRLMYYGWRKVVLWPNRGEIKLSILRGSNKEFEEFFKKRIDGKSYFLITAFGQYEDQPALKQMLADNFPILAQGSGYLIFDLVHPKSQN